jgi:hypothetical protein
MAWDNTTRGSAMAIADNPPAIVRERDDFLKLAQRAMEAANELKARPEAPETKDKLAICRDDLNRRLSVFIDGDLSIENGWRRICEAHVKYGSATIEGETERVEALFQQHLDILHAIQAQPAFQSMAELGYAVPRFAEIPDAIEETEEIRDKILERWPLTELEFAYAFPVDVEDVIYVSPRAYFRSILTTLWNTFRHPFTTTYVDLSTGDSVTLANPVDEASNAGANQ